LVEVSAFSPAASVTAQIDPNPSACSVLTLVVTVLA
jgi:hypothetical protein